MDNMGFGPNPATHEPSLKSRPSGECPGYGGSTKIEDWTRWISSASKADMERELTRIYSANDDSIVGDIACKVMSYDWAHMDAEEMGYPSLTEALEALARIEAEGRDVKQARGASPKAGLAPKDTA